MIQQAIDPKTSPPKSSPVFVATSIPAAVAEQSEELQSLYREFASCIAFPPEGRISGGVVFTERRLRFRSLATAGGFISRASRLLVDHAESSCGEPFRFTLWHVVEREGQSASFEAETLEGEVGSEVAKAEGESADGGGPDSRPDNN